MTDQTTLTGLFPTAERTVLGRIVALDMARAAALLAMAIFHLTFDLEMFGFAPPGTTFQPFWRWLAYLTAGSFMVLVGIGLWLAHGRGIRWHGFWRRFAVVVAAALAITAVTYVAIGPGFVFFGILHSIALGSLLGLAFLRLPVGVLLAIGLGVILVPNVARFAVFDVPWLWWVGLQQVPVISVDYEPIFPWFGLVLIGIGLSKWADARGFWMRLRAWQPPIWAERIGWFGRHSLVVYLAHQPILVSLVWLAAQILR